MASAPKTAGFHLATSQGKGATIGRTPLIGDSKQFLEWTGKRPAKSVSQVMQETQDRIRRTRPLAALTTKVANARHDTDMYRIGGGAVGPVKSGFESQARVRPRISFVRDANGKIVPERRARTFQRSNVPWRPELPIGKPSETSPPIGRRVNGRTVANPAYAEWKNSHLEYNSAISRQQMLQPSNRVIQTIQPTSQTPTARYNAPVTKTYVRRGGQSGPTPSRETLGELHSINPYTQVV